MNQTMMGLARDISIGSMGSMHSIGLMGREESI